MSNSINPRTPEADTEPPGDESSLAGRKRQRSSSAVAKTAAAVGGKSIAQPRLLDAYLDTDFNNRSPSAASLSAGGSSTAGSGAVHVSTDVLTPPTAVVRRTGREREQADGKPGGPLFEEDHGRFVLFPIRYPAVYDMYIVALRSFWTKDELDLRKDLYDFDYRLTDNERHYVKYVLAFFAGSDGIVNENLVLNMMSVVTLPEARCFYGFQIMIENVHAETYSMLISTYIRDAEQQAFLFNGIDTIPCIRKKADWALRHIENGSFAERLVAFAAVEGIFFSGSFCAIFWLRKRGLMLGLAEANELISRDEGLHTDFACLLYRMLLPEDRLSEASVQAIVAEAVQYEQEFVNDALPVALIGMNSTLMCRYIEFVADRLLSALGCAKLYGSGNPFEWMEQISMTTKTNIHERGSTEYSRSVTDGTVRLDEDFD